MSQASAFSTTKKHTKPRKKAYECVPKSVVPPDTQCFLLKYKDTTSTTLVGTAANFPTAITIANFPPNATGFAYANTNMPKFYCNSLYQHDVSSTGPEKFPYLNAWGALYDRALVTKVTYNVTFTNLQTTPYRVFIMFLPFTNSQVSTAGYDPPATQWNTSGGNTGWDNLLVPGTNGYWARSAIMGGNTMAQGQCKLSHEMYLPDQYGDPRQYLSIVEGDAVDFTNKLPGVSALAGNPQSVLLAYIGWLTMTTTPASPSMACEITATLETKFFRVTLASS